MERRNPAHAGGSECGGVVRLERVSRRADRVVSLAAILPHRPLDRSLPGVAEGRAAASRQRPEPECRHYGCPIGEDHGRVSPHPRRTSLISVSKVASTIKWSIRCGLPLSYHVTPANVHNTFGARCFLAGQKYFVPCLKPTLAAGVRYTTGNAPSDCPVASLARKWSP